MTQISGIRIAEFGGPEVMSFETWDGKTPGEGEILVHNHAIGVNFIDIYHRSGLYPIPLPSGIGLEAAGVVEAVGPGVDNRAKGDRVAYCSGPLGAYAEAHLISADRSVKLPDAIGFDTIGSSLLKGLTVQYLIRQIHPCGPDDTVLFHAGAGGVGQIAIQWLKALGTTVIATAGGAEKCALARSLGADHVIDYRAEPFAPKVRDLTGGKGVRVVYDGVGKDTWEGSLDSVQGRGLIVSFGNASGPVKDVDLGVLAAKGGLFVTRPSLAHYTATPEALQASADDYFAVLQSGAVSIADPTVYGLRDAQQAHRDLASRKTTGSLIMHP